VADITIESYGDTLVLFFGTEQKRINAYTLASTLAGIADAAKAANASVNPGYEVEIVVEALESGSFRATLKAIYREANNLFTADSARNIILGIVATLIYEHTLAPHNEVIVNVGPSEVVVTRGEDRIVVPRIVYEATRQVEQNAQVRAGLNQAIRAVQADQDIVSFGLTPERREQPTVVIRRELLVALPAEFVADPATIRTIDEQTEVQILRAILEKSKRRWEFVWNGTRISAPVTDDSFFEDFFAHRVTIAPGDALLVKLRIRQRRVPDLNVYINDSFEVVEVLKHIPRREHPDLGMR
jgi:hypothetical protein